MRFLGFVPLETLRVFYRAAAVFAFPSLYEGFGLAPLEAMACGTPVVASDIPAAGGSGGRSGGTGEPRQCLRYRARDCARFCSIDKRRQQLAAAGPRQAAAFIGTKQRAKFWVYREINH